jgi:hypothetical protein
MIPNTFEGQTPMEIKQMDNIEAIIQVVLDEMDKRFKPIETKLAELASANGTPDQMWPSLMEVLKDIDLVKKSIGYEEPRSDRPNLGDRLAAIRSGRTEPVKHPYSAETMAKLHRIGKPKVESESNQRE